MLKELCKLCKKRHGGPCNVFYGVANDSIPVVHNPVVSHAPAHSVVHSVVHKPTETRQDKELPAARKTHGRYSDPEKRREYRRLWMAKCRAACK